jgi:hypothetical protein
LREVQVFWNTSSPAGEKTSRWTSTVRVVVLDTTAVSLTLSEGSTLCDDTRAAALTPLLVTAATSPVRAAELQGEEVKPRVVTRPVAKSAATTARIRPDLALDTWSSIADLHMIAAERDEQVFCSACPSRPTLMTP